MTLTFAISLTIITMASMWACYKLGQQNVLDEFERYYMKKKLESEKLQANLNNLPKYTILGDDNNNQ
jgi:hypothetical protein